MNIVIFFSVLSTNLRKNHNFLFRPVFSFLTIITSLENELKVSHDFNEDIVINADEANTYNNLTRVSQIKNLSKSRSSL